MPPGLSIKAYNHLFGECGVSFFGVEKLAKPLQSEFPYSLNEAPMLLPMAMSSLRGLLDQWFE
jgi:LysR family transcriptional regulator, transcriptional activator of nhaA